MTETKKMKKRSKKKIGRIKKSLTKADLVGAIMADNNGKNVASKAQVEQIVDLVFDNIVKLTNSGDKLFIHQFGVFNKMTVKARAYKTPNGEVGDKPAYDKLAFKPSTFVTKSFNE